MWHAEADTSIQSNIAVDINQSNSLAWLVFWVACRNLWRVAYLEIDGKLSHNLGAVGLEDCHSVNSTRRCVQLMSSCQLHGGRVQGQEQ